VRVVWRYPFSFKAQVSSGGGQPPQVKTMVIDLSKNKKKEKSNCTLCKEEIAGGALHCSKGTACFKCSKDISLAQYQPLTSFHSVLWVLAETYFRKGRGEDVTFEQIWCEHMNLKLVRFEKIWEMPK